MHSREGANIVMIGQDGERIETPGPYDNRMQIDQRLGPATVFDNRWPVLGLWMIDQECCGLGIRESAGPITDNLSSFVPHIFR